MPILNERPPLFRHIKDDIHELAQDLRWQDPLTKIKYTVSAGFKWDLGSVPSLIPDFVVPDGDRMTYPSCIHDWFYAYHNVSRADADRMLRVFMVEQGMPHWRAWSAWLAVRIYGGSPWRKPRGL